MADTPVYILTSESVTEGHPDKMADQVSDAILDAVLAQDPSDRVGCETLVTTGTCIVTAEITATAKIDVPKVVRDTIESTGYTDSRHEFDCQTCGVHNLIQAQSPDIAIGAADPVSVTVNGFGIGIIADERFTNLVRENFDLTPRALSTRSSYGGPFTA